MKRVIGALLLGAGWAAGAGAAPAAVQQVGTVPIPNLAAYWPFDAATSNVTPDLSGNNNNGTLTNGAVIDTANVAPGLLAPNLGSSGYPTLGAGNRINVPDSASLSVTGSITVAAFIRTNLPVAPAVLPNANQQEIAGKFDAAPAPDNFANGYYLRLTQSNHLSWNIVQAAGGPVGINSSPRTIPTGTWTHVAGVYDTNGGTLTMYINGLPDPTTAPPATTVTTPPGNGTSALTVGRNGSNEFNGNIDELRIYNRPLTQGEVNLLRTGQEPPTGLLATPGTGSISLSWTPPAAVPGVTVTYAVKRATATGGPYTVIATGVTGTTYQDSGLPFGATFFYVVSAVSVMESADSSEAFTTTLNLPPRTNDHAEGLFDDRCACGSIPSPAAPWGALAALLLLAVRRRPS